MGLGIIELIAQLLKIVAAYFSYRFSPEQVKKRDQINAELLKERNREEIDKILAGGNTISMSVFFSEYLSRLREKAGADPVTGGKTDILDRILPKQRDEESRNKDDKEGFSG
jgi:hypothetical protein